MQKNYKASHGVKRATICIAINWKYIFIFTFWGLTPDFLDVLEDSFKKMLENEVYKSDLFGDL